MRLLTVSLLALIAASPALAQSVEPGDDWRIMANAELQARLNVERREGRARNVILFIADGMNIATVSAARIYDGQTRGEPGEGSRLSFESMEASAFIRTYTANAQVPDSAATASAMNTGVKVDLRALNVYAGSGLDVCSGGARPSTLLELAEDRGMSTGIVTTSRLTHATPAATFAHTPSRYWEADSDLPEEAIGAGCRDIARQLIEFEGGDGIDLAFGGGRENFLPESAGGERSDGRDLISEWTAGGGAYLSDAGDLRAIETDANLLGLFSEDHLDYEHDRDDTRQPGLAEMTAFAIDRLSQNENGYYLMVEAARVDHAHHATNAYRALDDMQAYSEAITAALSMVDLDETLVIVTADHGHTFVFSGVYQPAGHPILGLVDTVTAEGTERRMADDGHPYTTLGYYTGQNPRLPGSEEITPEMASHPDYRQQSAVPMLSEAHSGEDVPLYASGPWAHLFGGTLEQHTIYHVMVHALGWNREDEALEQVPSD
jgi:alkaline phosphatase